VPQAASCTAAIAKGARGNAKRRDFLPQDPDRAARPQAMCSLRSLSGAECFSVARWMLLARGHSFMPVIEFAEWRRWFSTSR
jgi:hypothetical protein